jgi:hypothetical protein
MIFKPIILGPLPNDLSGLYAMIRQKWQDALDDREKSLGYCEALVEVMELLKEMGADCCSRSDYDPDLEEEIE